MILTKVEGDTVRLSLDGDVTSAIREQLLRRVQELIEDRRLNTLIFCLASVRSIDAGGLRALRQARDDWKGSAKQRSTQLHPMMLNHVGLKVRAYVFLDAACGA